MPTAWVVVGSALTVAAFALLVEVTLLMGSLVFTFSKVSKTFHTLSTKVQSQEQNKKGSMYFTKLCIYIFCTTIYKQLFAANKLAKFYSTLFLGVWSNNLQQAKTVLAYLLNYSDSENAYARVTYYCKNSAKFSYRLCLFWLNSAFSHNVWLEFKIKVMLLTVIKLLHNRSTLVQLVFTQSLSNAHLCSYSVSLKFTSGGKESNSFLIHLECLRVTFFKSWFEQQYYKVRSIWILNS